MTSRPHCIRLTRRRALALGFVAPLATSEPVVAEPPTDIAAGLASRVAAANDAFIDGDMRTWLRLVGPVAPDFTLFQPFGGPATRGFDDSPQHLDELASRFHGGVAAQELVATYDGGDLVVLVFIERQRSKVGGLPEQDWSLRVTQVYRRRGAGWEIVHRHADPLSRSRSLEATAALARG